MKVVANGLKNYVDANNLGNFYVSIGGRFYYQNAPQNATFPYCVHWLPNDKYDPFFVEDYQDLIIQFDIYDKSRDASTIYDVGSYLTALFDDAPITVVGYSTIMMKRDFAIPAVFDIEARVWQYTFQYRMYIEKNRT